MIQYSLEPLNMRDTFSKLIVKYQCSRIKIMYPPAHIRFATQTQYTKMNSVINVYIKQKNGSVDYHSLYPSIGTLQPRKLTAMIKH